MPSLFQLMVGGNQGDRDATFMQKYAENDIDLDAVTALATDCCTWDNL